MNWWIWQSLKVLTWIVKIVFDIQCVCRSQWACRSLCRTTCLSWTPSWPTWVMPGTLARRMETLRPGLWSAPPMHMETTTVTWNHVQGRNHLAGKKWLEYSIHLASKQHNIIVDWIRSLWSKIWKMHFKDDLHMIYYILLII